MFGHFAMALCKSLLHGPLLALVAFPIAVVSGLPSLFLFFLAPFFIALQAVGVVLIIGLSLVIGFVSSLIFWTALARLAGLWAGLGKGMQAHPFSKSLWAAVPVVLILHLIGAALGGAVYLVPGPLAEALTSEQLAEVTWAMEAVVMPLFGMLYLLTLVILLLPGVNGAVVEHSLAYSFRYLAARLLIVVPIFLGVGALVTVAFFSLLSMTFLPQSLEGGSPVAIGTIGVSVVFIFFVCWSFIGGLMAFEANLLARFAQQSRSEPLAAMATEPTPDYRAMRKQWDARGRD